MGGSTQRLYNGQKQKPPYGTPINLRPFFSFYGGKWRNAVNQYPKPEHRIIVEPFAGSAGYSVRYAHHKVILCEKDEQIAAVWDYLIRAKASEIRKLPKTIPESGTVDDLKIPDEAKLLVGFWLNRGVSRPRKTPSKWMRKGIRPGSFWGARVIEAIALQADQINHWRLLNCSYEELDRKLGKYVKGKHSRENITWFIDPPYEQAGKHYFHGAEDIDFEALGDWCKSRKGQAIVCENDGASWLPFIQLADFKTTRVNQRSKEVIWTNKETNTDKT